MVLIFNKNICLTLDAHPHYYRDTDRSVETDHATNSMNKSQRQHLEYIMLLPRTLSVDVHRAEEGGFWAKVKALPGCNTQGEDFIDLVDMINDAVFTYFDVPQKMRNALGRYVPSLSEKMRGGTDAETRHAAIEQAVVKIIRNKKTLAFSNIGLS